MSSSPRTSSPATRRKVTAPTDPFSTNHNAANASAGTNHSGAPPPLPEKHSQNDYGNVEVDRRTPSGTPTKVPLRTHSHKGKVSGGYDGI